MGNYELRSTKYELKRHGGGFGGIFGERGQRAIGGKVGECGFPGFPCGVEAQEGAAVFLVVLQQPPARLAFFQLCSVSGVEVYHGGG